MKIYISCLQIMEKGWNIPSYYNRDSKAQQKDHQIYSNKMQKHHHWIGVFNLLKTYKPRGALPRRHLCTFRILIPYYFIPYIMALCHSAILPFCHSAILPFRHSAIPPFRHSAIPPFRHSAPICNNVMYVSQEVLRKAVTLPGGLQSSRYVPPLQAKEV